MRAILLKCRLTQTSSFAMTQQNKSYKRQIKIVVTFEDFTGPDFKSNNLVSVINSIITKKKKAK